jgi:hypothetical protein
MGLHRLRLGVLALALSGHAALAADDAAVIRTLEQRQCESCQLQDADLVHADLRDAQLRGAALQRANLSGAQLDGADLRGSNLSFTSLAGASLRGADLRGSQLEGTDLRGSDLSGAQLEMGALERAHWQGAKGISPAVQSYAELHNAGVRAAEAGRFPEAEAFFNSAIQRLPDAAVSWVARGMSRAEQGNLSLAAQDLRYASKLYGAMGDEPQAKALERASEQLLAPSKTAKRGNGMGSALLGGAMAAFKIIAPIAAKAVLPGAL